MKPVPTKIPSEAPKDVTTPAMSKEPKHVTAQLINTGKVPKLLVIQYKHVWL
jgi:hypothetical protein